MPAKKAVARAVDPDLVPEDAGIESWKNVTPGTVYLAKIGEYGKRVTELIYGGRVFTITPQERRLNQNACATPELDMFTNGTLEAVSLLEDEPDTPKLRDNPNMLDEKEIARLFKTRGENFSERVSTITNLATINRLLELARDPRLNATVQQFEILRRRERVVAGDPEAGKAPTQAPTGPPADAGLPRAVTPR